MLMTILIQEIREEAKAEERDLINQEAKKNQDSIEAEKVRIQQLHEDEVRELKSKIEELQNENQARDKKRLIELTRMIETADAYRRIWKVAVIICSIILAIALIASIVVYVFCRDKEWYSPIMNYVTSICTILPVIMAIALFVYGLVKEKSVNMLGIINSILDNRKDAKLRRLGFSLEEYNGLNERIN